MIEPPTQTQELAILGETLQEMSDRIAGEHGVSSVMLRNLVYSESRWNPDAESPTGDCGLVQINTEVNPSGEVVPCEQAKDPAYALNFAARYIAEGKAEQWVACNCYLLVQAKIGRLPHMADILPNTTPHVGAVAILQYGALKHIAIITKISGTGFTVQEANIKPCLIGAREISWGDAHLVGFWSRDGGR